jgi:hypothetical protein
MEGLRNRLGYPLSHWLESEKRSLSSAPGSSSMAASSSTVSSIRNDAEGSMNSGVNRTETTKRLGAANIPSTETEKASDDKKDAKRKKKGRGKGCKKRKC